MVSETGNRMIFFFLGLHNFSYGVQYNAMKCADAPLNPGLVQGFVFNAEGEYALYKIYNGGTLL